MLLRRAPQIARQADSTRWQTLVLWCTLPMFAQCFQYMVDVMPLYLLSKAWPIMMLPFGIWAMLALDLPYKPLYAATLAWILGVTPFIGIVVLGNEFIAAFTTTAKVWSYTYMFSLAGMLVMLRPDRDTLRRALNGLGVATFAIMLVLWFVVPARLYGGGDRVTKLFMYDPERGYHIYMPMFFGMLGIFTLNRSFWARPKLWKLVGLIGGFAVLLIIYKERASIAAAAGAIVIAVAAAMSMGRWRRTAFLLLTTGGFAAVLLALERMQHLTSLPGNFGGSLATRAVSVATAWQYLSINPLRWLFGVGATTRFGNVTLSQLFGNAAFFLTDIGWLGVIFEYGAIGALLMFLVHLAGLRQAYRLAPPNDPLAQALGDYVIYLILASAVYAVTFTPGELTSVIALSFYFAWQARVSPERYGAQPQSPAVKPRQSAVASVRPSGLVASISPSGRANKG